MAFFLEFEISTARIFQLPVLSLVIFMYVLQSLVKAPVGGFEVGLKLGLQEICFFCRFC